MINRILNFLAKTFNPELIKKHPLAIIFIWFLFLLAPASLLLFGAFLLWGSFTIIDLGLGERNALLTDIILSLIFFLQHSIMVRRGFKKQLGKFLPGPYHKAFYGLISAMTLIVTLIFWQKSSTIIVSADGFIYGSLYLLFFICIAGFFWGITSLDSFDAFGVNHVMHYIFGKPERPQKITAKGPYRWVRHPLYLFMIVLIWACPVMTLDRLIFNVMWSIWIIIGTYLEDKDLHREFGNPYSEYSSKVPMLIPWRILRDKSL